MSEKILVVDDNKLNILLLKQILSDEDYEVHVLTSGAHVLEKSLEIKPDAILLDIMMPEIDGFEVCSMLKEEPITKNIPVIMVTAKTQGEDLKKAFNLGAFDYVKKPIDEVEVISRLRSALKYNAQQKVLETMAMTDGLTGLYNHKLILDLFDKEYKKAKRNNQAIAFLMLDIDHFKKVNDTYGHKTGDEVLQRLADILRKNSRNSDLLGRYGGEEFCIILPNIKIEESQFVCERIRKAVEESKITFKDQTINITISIGNCFNHPMSTYSEEDVIIRADEALYKAKNNGRNRTETVILK